METEVPATRCFSEQIFQLLTAIKPIEHGGTGLGLTETQVSKIREWLKNVSQNGAV